MTRGNLNEFKLENRGEVEKFQTLLEEYSTTYAQFPFRYINLLESFDCLQGKEMGAQIFTALLDLKINLILLDLDIHQSAVTWNGYFSRGKLEGGTVLDSREKFFGKMNIHRYNTAFIFRYRAIWDKIMGLLILLHAPTNYRDFLKAKSRKKFFSHLVKDIPQIQESAILEVHEFITAFDSEFRTPEAHNTGRLRKFSFNMDSLSANPAGELMGYWNQLLRAVSSLDKMLKFIKGA